MIAREIVAGTSKSSVVVGGSVEEEEVLLLLSFSYSQSSRSFEVRETIGGLLLLVFDDGL